MLFAVAGEGPSDIGVCNGVNSICETPEFRVGPMTVIINQVIEKRRDYSPMEYGMFRCVTRQCLEQSALELKAAKKSLGLPGPDRPKETRYYFNEARVLARIAMELSTDNNNIDVVAVLFHDSDGTASAGRGLWAEKRKSIIDGFDYEQFPRGVPMIPKPKSEAWLLCAMKSNSYQNCDQLEERSGNDNSPNNLKGDLEKIVGNAELITELCDRLYDGRVDIDRIQMSSFSAFRNRLEEVI